MMPYADPERQQQYYRERQERRKNDPEYKAGRNARVRERYDADPEFRRGVRDYHNSYRAERRAVDAEYRERMRVESLEYGRRLRGLRWSPDQKASFEALTACEVCSDETKLAADHCHDCGAYRGGLCTGCNTAEGYLRKWGAVCPEGSPMRVYMDRHSCGGMLERALEQIQGDTSDGE